MSTLTIQDGMTELLLHPATVGKLARLCEAHVTGAPLSEADLAAAMELSVMFKALSIASTFQVELTPVEAKRIMLYTFDGVEV